MTDLPEAQEPEAKTSADGQDRPPHTGHPAIDDALAEFGAVGDHAPTDHLDRFTQVSDVLTAVLENRQGTIPGTDAGPPRPGPRQPGQPQPGPSPQGSR